MIFIAFLYASNFLFAMRQSRNGRRSERPTCKQPGIQTESSGNMNRSKQQTHIRMTHTYLYIYMYILVFRTLLMVVAAVMLNRPTDNETRERWNTYCMNNIANTYMCTCVSVCMWKYVYARIWVRRVQKHASALRRDRTNDEGKYKMCICIQVCVWRCAL